MSESNPYTSPRSIDPLTSVNVTVTAQTNHGEQPTLVLSGKIDGTELHQFARRLDEVLHYPPGSTVTIDLSGVTSWSMVAQAMILSTSRIVSRHGSHLVLLGPSAALRRESKHLDVFGRVTTRDHQPERRRASLGSARASVALLIIEHGCLLMVRKHGAETLELPGGMIKPSEDPRTVLVRHVDRQLGIVLDWPTIHESMTVRSTVAGEPRRRLHETCFHARFSGLATPCGEVTALVWTRSGTPEPIALASLEVRAILKRGLYIE